MLENLKDKADALTQIADIIGKKPLVIMIIVLLFTTGYLYSDGKKEERRLNDIRIEELKVSQEKLLEAVKGIKAKQDIYIPKLDTTINKANKTLERLNNK